VIVINSINRHACQFVIRFQRAQNLLQTSWFHAVVITEESAKIAPYYFDDFKNVAVVAQRGLKTYIPDR
jgi:hypothetical protein